MSFLPQELIRRKRDGGVLSPAELSAFARGLADGSVGDGQAAAFAMAVFFRDMAIDERVAFTVALRDSGRVLDWAALGLDRQRVVDKHSTGGVGDKVSLMLAPMVAACGGLVPMISGRGLGHTGGTLDKFDSIPGYQTAPDNDTFVKVVREVGCAIIGQTADLAPADRRLYAIRDVTATVENLSLITASILSKKLAAGLGGLAMDVKFGSGAFMVAFDKAKELAESIATVATGAGVPTVALLTDMNQVLGDTVGNALEMREAIEFLTGQRREPRLLEVTLALSAEMLVLAGISDTLDAARTHLHAKLDDGSAAEIFGKMVAALGGPADFIDSPDTHLAAAPVTLTVTAERAGVVMPYDTRQLGLALIQLGGGRIDPRQGIDYAVGFSHVIGVGQAVSAGQPLAVVHARDEAAAQRAAQVVRETLALGDTAALATPLIAARIVG